jgi:hypothetical protein
MILDVRFVSVGMLLLAVSASCAGDGGRETGATSTSGPATSTTATTSTTVAAPTSAPFRSAVAPVTAADLGASWREGCPVGPADLRMVTVSLVGFDDRDHTGRVVVHADVADQVVEVFRQLHVNRFPVRTMRPIFTQAEFEDFETPDDNSSGFSCRNAVDSDAAPSWSRHAFGHAIDVNPIENPYLEGGRIIPAAGAAYTDRDVARPGMAVEGGVLVEAFRSVGWEWGASFSDYQHFSTDGR